jgi:F-type H+-transporting ATPase subunit c
MKTKFMLITIFILLLSVAVFAQEQTTEPVQTTDQQKSNLSTDGGAGAAPLNADRNYKVRDATGLFLWSIIIGAIALCLAAIGGAWAQSMALQKAVDNIGRNPAAADSIRGVLIIGLALIESLVIYVLLVDLIIYFVKWGEFAW